MSVSWAGLAERGRPEDVIYLADGAIRLRVQGVRAGDGEIETAVEIGGSVASRQGLNIPGSTRGLPAVPEEDLDMLALRRVDRRRPGRAVVRAHGRGRDDACASTRACR